jgi:IclR family KDG regulon transcriptional repressor
MRRDKANYLIQSVSHAVDVLDELIKGPGEVGVTELSKRLKLHKNNVFRLLATLELRGLVEQNKETEDYRLGVRALHLGQAFVANSTVLAKVTPVLKGLSERLGETVGFATLHNQEVHFPVSLDARRSVKVSGRGAQNLAARSVGVGKLLLAQLPDATLADYLGSPNAEIAALKTQLAELKAAGTCVERFGPDNEVVAISRVVRGVRSEVVGAIEILAPQYRVKPEAIMPIVEEIANSLSQTLGAVKGGLISSIEKEVVRAKEMKEASHPVGPTTSTVIGSV